ncbi:hypothetical protein JXA80_04835, partial [bacterium]|nr:hypothetical protein [candidate division CSSED10-310 bacterium]
TIYRAPAPEGPFAVIGLANMESTEFVDTGNAMPVPGAVTDESGEPTDPEENPIDSEEAPGLQSGMPYYYKLGISTVDAGERLSPVTGPITARPQWFHTGKTPIMVGTVLFFVLVALFIELARRGWVTYVRPIAGMNEIVNAIGRATEMGRPILYVLGLGAPDEIATIASYTILARVARRTAEYRTTLIVPCNEPIVMTIAQETVKNAYIEAGHPDAYNEDMVYFVTSMQFAYVAAVNGIMLRERTATNCYFGKFYAESLLLSETGNIAGSIQVAGTDEVAQLPFFVTTCDYTLIGEELYAASAYLGRDPLLLGALKAQDLAKAIIMLLIIIGTILISFDISWLQEIVSVNV